MINEYRMENIELCHLMEDHKNYDFVRLRILDNHKVKLFVYRHAQNVVCVVSLVYR